MFWASRILASFCFCSQLFFSYSEDPSCPCINPFPAGLPSNLTGAINGQQCFVSRSSGQALCHPLDYGAAGCSSYDAGLPPDCVDDGTVATFEKLPAFCHDAWCWVNATNCNVDFEASAYWSGIGLHYSYATCGSLDHFAEARLVESLKGHTLRVGVPGLEPPFLLRKDGRVGGIAPEFLASMANDASFKVSYRSIQNDSRAVFPQSSYTACVRDVALKRLDLCTGIFWETPQRRALTLFSPLFFPDLFSLIVLKQEKGTDLLTMVGKVFKPFSPGLWALTMTMTLLVGLTLWLFGEFDGKPQLTGLAMSVELALLKFMGQTGWGRLKTVGSGFIATGFGFVCMVAMASYMANTSAMLLSQDDLPQYESMDDALAQGALICVLEPLRGPLIGKYPSQGHLFVYTGWFDESLAKMNSGECNAMLLNENEFQRMQGGVDYYGESEGGKTANCNKVRVGDVVLSMPVAMPLNKDLAFALSYLVTVAHSQSAWDSVAHKYATKTNLCKKQSKKKVEPLSIDDLSGALIIAVTMLACGLVLNYAEPYVERLFVKEKANLENLKGMVECRRVELKKEEGSPSVWRTEGPVSSIQQTIPSGSEQQLGTSSDDIPEPHTPGCRDDVAFRSKGSLSLRQSEFGLRESSNAYVDCV